MLNTTYRFVTLEAKALPWSLSPFAFSIAGGTINMIAPYLIDAMRF